MSDANPAAGDQDLSRVRNFGVVAHIDAGKTTLSERMLVRTGVETRLGEVEDGTATMDWMTEERERGISITAAATSLPWRAHQLHLIDTPGHVDFTIEVERSLRVLDGAIVVFDVLAGVQAQSESVWRQLRRHGCAAVAFVNKLDRPGADFMAAVAAIEKRLGVHCAPVTYPFYRGSELVLVADIVRRRALGASHRADPARPQELPEEIAAEVGVLRAELAELLAAEEVRVLELVVEGRDVPDALLLEALRQRTLQGTLLPVACGSALHSIGIDGALDLVVDFLPAPTDMPPKRALNADGEELLLRPSAAEPLVLYAFKVQRLAGRELVFVRVMRGILEVGAELVLARTAARLQVRAIFRPHADHLEPQTRALCGEIVALEGLDLASTGDTLCAPGAVVRMGGMDLPTPVMGLAVEPLQAIDRDRLREGLARLVREDPSLAVREDEATGEWSLSGMGELHLEIALAHLRADTGLEVRQAAPRVSYREVLTAPAHAAARIERSFGNATLAGAVELELSPVRELGAAEVTFGPGDGSWSSYQPAIAASLLALSQVGPASGHPLWGARIHVRSARRPGDLDSEPGVLQAVGSAWHDLLSRLKVDLCEPVMSFEVLTPSSYAGGVLGDLQARGANIAAVQSQGASTIIQGQVPLVGMFGYASAMRSLSQGRAEFVMVPAGMRALPRAESVARGLIFD